MRVDLAKTNFFDTLLSVVCISWNTLDAATGLSIGSQTVIDHLATKSVIGAIVTNYTNRTDISVVDLAL